MESMTENADRIPFRQASWDDVTLRPMTAGELAARIAQVMAGFAESLVLASGLPLDEARVEAARRTDELLPQGVHTEGMLLWTAEAGGRPVGWIWVALPRRNRPGTAWIYMVAVDEDQQGKGYG